MSRSRKNTPIIGNTTAVSDKPGKKQANKSYRRKAKTELLNGNEFATKHNRFSTSWDMPKDGKHYVKDLDKKHLRK